MTVTTPIHTEKHREEARNLFGPMWDDMAAADRIAALERENRQFREAAKSALLTLCAAEHGQSWHENMAKDFTFAIEATRAALGIASPAPAPNKAVHDYIRTLISDHEVSADYCDRTARVAGSTGRAGLAIKKAAESTAHKFMAEAGRAVSGLLPCARCGGKGYFMEVPDHPSDPNSGSVCIECIQCRMTTPLAFPVKDDPRPHLVEMWNRRVPDQQQADHIKALEGEVELHKRDAGQARADFVDCNSERQHWYDRAVQLKVALLRAQHYMGNCGVDIERDYPEIVAALSGTVSPAPDGKHE